MKSHLLLFATEQIKVALLEAGPYNSDDEMAATTNGLLSCDPTDDDLNLSLTTFDIGSEVLVEF